MKTKMIVLATGLTMLLSGGAYAQAPVSQTAAPKQESVKTEKQEIKKDVKKEVKQKRKDKKKKRGNK